MRDQQRAWFVVALCAIVVALSSAPIASAQTTDPDAGVPAAPAEETPPAAEEPAAEPADGEIAQEEREEAAEEAREEAAEESAEALGSTSVEQDMEAEEEEGDAAEAEVAAEETQAAREPLPWRNSFFSWTHGVTPNTFIRDAQLSYNPLYYWSFNLAPRWYLDSATFFFVSQSLSYEFTEDDGSSAYNHDLSLSDTIVELRRTVSWEGFIFIPAARVVLPASKLSQAAQRYFAGGLGLTAVRVIPEAASLTIALVGRYQYWFAGRNTPGTMGTFPAETAPRTPITPITPAGPEGDQASGVSSARHVITAGMNLTITPVSGLTVSGSAFWQSQEGHGLAGYCTGGVMTSPDGSFCEGDNSPTHWRHFTSLSLSVAYDILPWFNLSIGWSNSSVLAPFFDDNGNVRGPFNPDNNFFLTASFQLDGIYEAIIGGEDDGLTPEQRQRRRQGLAMGSSTGGSM